MAHVFRNDTSPNGERLWSFSYIDWQGRQQTGVGTESRRETIELAERVQAEHHSLRKHRRASASVEGAEQVAAPEAGVRLATPVPWPLAGAASAEGGLRDFADEHPDAHDAPGNQRLGERMVEANLISEEDLQWALRHQEAHGGRFVEVLIEHRKLSREDYVRFMGRQPSTPFIDLDNCHIPRTMAELIPLHLAQELEALPIDRMGKMLSVAMVCPVDKNAITRLQQHTGLQVRPMLCSHTGFDNALMRLYR